MGLKFSFLALWTPSYGGMVISKCIDVSLKSLGRTQQKLRDFQVKFHIWGLRKRRQPEFDRFSSQPSIKSPISNHGNFQTFDWNVSGTAAETFLSMTKSATQLQPSRWSFLFSSTKVIQRKIWRLCDSLKPRYSNNTNSAPLMCARSSVIFMNIVSNVHTLNLLIKINW